MRRARLKIIPKICKVKRQAVVATPDPPLNATSASENSPALSALATVPNEESGTTAQEAKQTDKSCSLVTLVPVNADGLTAEKPIHVIEDNTCTASDMSKAAPSKSESAMTGAVLPEVEVCSIANSEDHRIFQSCSVTDAGLPHLMAAGNLVIKEKNGYEAISKDSNVLEKSSSSLLSSSSRTVPTNAPQRRARFAMKPKVKPKTKVGNVEACQSKVIQNNGNNANHTESIPTPADNLNNNCLVNENEIILNNCSNNYNKSLTPPKTNENSPNKTFVDVDEMCAISEGGVMLNPSGLTPPQEGPHSSVNDWIMNTSFPVSDVNDRSSVMEEAIQFPTSSISTTVANEIELSEDSQFVEKSFSLQNSCNVDISKSVPAATSNMNGPIFTTDLIKNKDQRPIGKLTKENLATVHCNKENVNNNLVSFTASDSASVCSLETTNENRAYRERKQKFRSKLLEGNIPKSSMTMFDLIYFNPADNPMPNRGEPTKIKPVEDNKASASNITCGNSVEEENADNVGRNKSQVGSDVEEPLLAGDEELLSDLDDGMPAPQLKIGPDGEVILDKQSLIIKSTEDQERLSQLSRDVIEESEYTQRSFSKKRKRALDWTANETTLFYKALSTVGTDFDMMSDLFFKKDNQAWRNRTQLKIKFKKEEKENPHLVNAALVDTTQYDMSLLDDEPGKHLQRNTACDCLMMSQVSIYNTIQHVTA